MVKIKGWKKIESSDSHYVWVQKNVPRGGIAQMVELKATRPAGTGARWSLNYGPNNTAFTSKSEALIFARKWMRSN